MSYQSKVLLRLQAKKPPILLKSRLKIEAAELEKEMSRSWKAWGGLYMTPARREMFPRWLTIVLPDLAVSVKN